MQHIGDVKPPERTHRDGATQEQRRAHIERLAANPGTAMLVCPDCRGLEMVCRVCDGFGIVCPTCRGSRFVRVGRADEGPEYHHHPLQSCPTCCDAAGKYDLHRMTDGVKWAMKRQAVRA